MDFSVTWTVSGDSTVEIDDADLREAADAGIDLEDSDAVWDWAVVKYGRELTSDIVRDFDSLDAPEIEDVMPLRSGAPQWWYDEYLEYDADGEFVGFKTKEAS